MRKLRFVFETIGTRGDVAPLLALAHELLRRGHDATLLAPSAFAPDACALGVAFVPITDQHLDHVGQIQLSNFYFPAFQRVVDHFGERQRDAKASRERPAATCNNEPKSEHLAASALR